MSLPLDAPTRILAIRHGETAWNRETRIQGSTDIGLNDSGLAQARCVAQALCEDTVHAVYSSDLRRARQTAEAICASTGAPLTLDAGLRERRFGVFEGLTWAEIAERFPSESLRWRQRDLSFAAKGGGEALPEFYARCIGAVRQIADAHPGQTVVIVAHGGVMDCLYRAATRLALDAPRSWLLGNATINRLLCTPDGLGLIGWNDDAHLAHLSLDEL